MKFALLVIDGAADSPNPELMGKTPLEAASTPNLDRLASRGTVGLVRTIPEGMPAGSEIGNLSVLGYDPGFHASGRAAWEAIGMGISLGPADLAVRCNLVSLRDAEQGYAIEHFGPELVLEDYSGGEIRSEESSALIRELNLALGSKWLQFYPGLDYRHLIVLRGQTLDNAECAMRNAEFNSAFGSPHSAPPGASVGPHAFCGERIGPHLPKDLVLLQLMGDAAHLLSGHPVNAGRIGRGLRPANGIWLWGEGRAKVLRSFQSLFGLSGATVSAVDVVRGIGCAAGLEPVFVPGATGRLDSDLSAKADAALRVLEKKDFVYLHVEAADEASHRRSLSDKIAAIERFDRDLLGRLVIGLSGGLSGERSKDWRIMVVPDHSTSAVTGAHGTEPVPFLIAVIEDSVAQPSRFTEEHGRRSGVFLRSGEELMQCFLQDECRWP